jgi:hypothetical protein
LSRIKLGIGSLLVATLLTSCSATRTETGNQTASTNANPDKPPIASTSVVKVTAQPLVVDKGAPSEAVVQLTIDAGYHINANPPTFPYLKATELEIPDNQGFSVNFVRYPDGKMKKFAFAEQPLAVYEGEALLKVHLKTNKSIKVGEQKIGARLRVQACDDQVCYAPGVIDFGIPVTVK